MVEEMRNAMKQAARMQRTSLDKCEYDYSTNSWEIYLTEERTLPPHPNNTSYVKVVEYCSQSIRITLVHDLDAGDDNRREVEVSFGTILSGFVLTAAQNYGSIVGSRA